MIAAATLEELADLFPTRRPGDVLAGRARYDGATGEYVLTYGAASSTIGGPCGMVAFADSIRRHGLTVDGLTRDDAGRVLCQLYRGPS